MTTAEEAFAVLRLRPVRYLVVASAFSIATINSYASSDTATAALLFIVGFLTAVVAARQDKRGLVRLTAAVFAAIGSLILSFPAIVIVVWAILLIDALLPT